MKMAILITTHNCGNAFGESKVLVKSYVIPFIESEWKIGVKDLLKMQTPDFDPESITLKLTPPFFAKVHVVSIALQPGASMTNSIEYGEYYILGPPHQEALKKVETKVLKSVNDAIVITTVDIAPADKEIFLANNNAIEITTLKNK